MGIQWIKKRLSAGAAPQRRQIAALRLIAALQQDVKTYLLLDLFDTKIPCLVDTGNLAALDLIDYEIYNKITNDKKQEILPVPDGQLEAIGGVSIAPQIVGRTKFNYKFENLTETWKGRPLVIRDLGFPFILSAKTIMKLPLIPDLSTSSAYIGTLGTRVPLYGLEEAWQKAKIPVEAPSEREEKPPTATLIPDANRNSNATARLIGAVQIPGNSGKTVKIRNVGSNNMLYVEFL